MFEGLEKFDYRFVDTDVFPNVIWIFGDYMANLVWIDREQTVAFTVRHKDVAKQYKHYFETLWKSGRKRTR
jgi:hypothetical protein